MFRDLLLVGAGGALGSMARYSITLAVNKVWERPMPLATLGINLGGCLLIGLLFGGAQRYQWTAASAMWLLLATGVCGGFTTFSAFALENLKLLQSSQAATAMIYILLSVTGGILLCWAGYLLAR